MHISPIRVTMSLSKLQRVGICVRSSYLAAFPKADIGLVAASVVGAPECGAALGAIPNIRRLLDDESISKPTVAD